MTVIKIKNSSMGGRKPTSLQTGELALNSADGKIFFKNNSNAIVELTGTTYPTLTAADASAGTSTVPSVITAAVLKTAITTHTASRLSLSGGTMSGVINMNNNNITNVGAPTANGDAVNRLYVDTGDRTNFPPMAGTSPSTRTIPITYSGRVLTIQSHPILLGGYYNTLTQRTLTVPASATSYIFLEKTLDDRSTISSSYGTAKTGENFYKVCIAKVVTNATAVTSIEFYKIDGFEGELSALQSEINALK